MKDKNPHGIGAAGRWLIFAGVPWAIIAVFIVCGQGSLDRVVGEKALPYVIFGTAAIFAIGGMILYNYFPKQYSIPVGIAGWAVTFLLLFWYYWFGPGAFGHQ